MDTLLGIKKGMTQGYDARQRRVGATVLKIEPNLVTQIKSIDGKDGYSALQLGIGSKKSVKKPQIGHLKKSGIEQKLRWLREVRSEVKVDLKPGQTIGLGDVFKVGDVVKVSGVSKGRGFAGVVKRHGFAGGPRTHGQSDRLRAPGAIGPGTTPGRVYKGQRMAGHMGVETVSVRGLEVIFVDKENNTLTVKGAVPGYSGGMVIITRLGQIKGYTPPPEEKVDEKEEENAT